MSQTVIIDFNRKEKDRLSRLALSFGLSLPEFSRKVLTQLDAAFPTESFDDYENPKAVRSAFNKALKNLRTGRIKTSL